VKIAANLGLVAPREPTTPAKSLETKHQGNRRGWDSNPLGRFRLCQLQILRCCHCRKCQRYRGALPAVARWLLLTETVRTHPVFITANIPTCATDARLHRPCKRRTIDGQDRNIKREDSARLISGKTISLLDRVAAGTLSDLWQCPSRALSLEGHHAPHGGAALCGAELGAGSLAAHAQLNTRHS
jgi:hypothetical protein